MIFKRLEIPDVQLIKGTVDCDSVTGYRQSVFSWTEMRKHGINHAFIYESEVRIEHENTLKGLYYQEIEAQESILVRCLTGSVLMKIVDIRPESRTYRKVITVKLSSENCEYVYIPYGMAHGILTTSDNTYLLYKSDNFYFEKSTKVLNCFDKHLNIEWPDVQYIMSAKDKYAPCVNVIEEGYFYDMDRRAQDEE